MKKFFAMFLLMFTITVAQANDSTAVVTTELTKETVYNDVKDVIKSLAENLKVGTEHVYGILVKQQLVRSITWLIIITFMTLGSIWGYKAANKLHDKDEEAAVPAFIFWGVGTAVCLVVAIIHLDVVVTGIINPEYGAITKIVSMIRGGGCN